MLRKRVFYLICYLLCLLLARGDIYSQTVETAPKPFITPSSQEKKEPQSLPEPENLIHHGDVIDVDIIGSTEYDWRGRVNPEGFLDGLDFVEEPINALCRSETDVAADVAKGYSKLLRDPQVKVRIVDKSGRPNSFLYGAVKNPQRFLIQRQVYLNELIVLAGGLTDKSSGEIQVLRPSKLSCGSSMKNLVETENQSQKISTDSASGTKIFNIKIADLLKGEKDSNPVIVNGDIITVLEAAPIYIIGGVLNPKSINAASKITVSRAIATAGGLSKNANEKNVSIFRRMADGTKIIRVNLEDVKAEKTEDIVLQKYDIVEVEQNGAEKRKLPPVIINEDPPKKSAEIPLRIVQ